MPLPHDIALLVFTPKSNLLPKYNDSFIGAIPFEFGNVWKQQIAVVDRLYLGVKTRKREVEETIWRDGDLERGRGKEVARR